MWTKCLFLQKTFTTVICYCRNSHHWELKNCSLVKELDQAAQVWPWCVVLCLQYVFVYQCGGAGARFFTKLESEPNFPCFTFLQLFSVEPRARAGGISKCRSRTLLMRILIRLYCSKQRSSRFFYYFCWYGNLGSGDPVQANLWGSDRIRILTIDIITISSDYRPWIDREEAAGLLT